MRRDQKAGPGRRITTVHIDEALLKELRKIAIDEGTSFGALTDEALSDWLARYRRRKAA